MHEVRGDDLQSLRDEVRKDSSKDDNEPSPERKQKKKRSRKHRHASYCDDDEPTYWLDVTGLAMAPYWIPVALLHDNYDLDAWFPPAPYEGADGSLLIDSPLTGESASWTAHLRGEYATDFGDQNRAGGSLLFEHSSRFGIDTSADYRYQDLPVGHDDLWTGDFNIVYRFAQSEHVQVRSGLGFNWLSDEIDTDLGFNFTYGADFFPAKPWVISTVIDWGRLGDVSLFHGRATVGLVFDRFDIYTGYDYYDVGGTQLDGFVAGIGVWLN